MQRQAVHDGVHREFPSTVINQIAIGVLKVHRSAADPGNAGGFGEIGGATDQAGKMGVVRFERSLGRDPRGDILTPFLGGLNEAPGQFPPVRGKAAGQTPVQFRRGVRVLGPVAGEHIIPLAFPVSAFSTGVEGAIVFRRNVERLMMPADMLAGRGDFGGAQWRAVRFLAAPLVGRSPGNGGLAANQGGAAGEGAGLLDGLMDRVGVVAVHVGNDMPTETFETLGHVLAEPTTDRAIDGNVVTVIETNQFTQSPSARQRAGFGGDTFHQAAIAENDVSVMIDDGKTGAVEAGGQRPFGQRHADAIGQTLP